MKTILVVEDSRAEQRLIVALLKQLDNVEVSLAESAEVALNWLENHPKPDLIVLDIIMPGLSGLDFCRQIRTQPEMEKIPIVFCTSKNQDFDRFWALRQGGTAYISKPYAPSDLMETVSAHLK